MKKTLSLLNVFVISLLLFSCNSQPELTPEEAKEIAKEAYIFAYPMLDHYKIMFGQALVEQSPGFEGPTNTLVHKRELLTAEFRTVVGANNSTLYSFCWMDLSAESLVVTVPPVADDRYFVFQFADMYTHNFAYSSPRLTGSDGGTYLVTGPNWKGEKPEGIDDVFTSEGDFVLMVGRIYIAGREELDIVHAIQDEIKLVTLSEFEGKDAQLESDFEFAVYNDEKAKSAEFITYFNFLLNHVQIHPTETDLFKKFARIGIGADKDFKVEELDPAIAEAITAGVQEALVAIGEHASKIGRKVEGWNNFGTGFGNREYMQGKYLIRAAAAMLGIYGNDMEENSTYSATFDVNGDPLDASKYNYILEFPAGQTPPVKGFWSITMYDSESYMVDNPIDRYSVYDKDALLTYGEGNSLKLYIQSSSPGADKEGNWLPAPDDIFGIALRVYWPQEQILDGSWTPPGLVRVEK